MRQFRELARTLTRAHDVPQPRRRGTGETREGFMLAARKLFRRSARIPSAAYAKPPLLWNTLDWLNPWQKQRAVTGHELDAACEAVHPEQDLYPHL